MQLPFFTLDVFTGQKFAGNQLAVVLDADELSDRRMQAIAREFNLSETIFVRAPKDQANTASVRIFFPTGEIPFAGHPTLGCAILLAERRHKPGCAFETEIRLEEVAGLVPVKVTRIGEASYGRFKAPVIPHHYEAELPSVQEAASALSLQPRDIGFDGHRIGVWQGGPAFLYIPLASRAALEQSRVSEPSWSRMIERARVDSVYLYTAGGDRLETSFRARMYSPAVGIMEDPATGSATAILAAQLRAAGALHEGTNRFQLEQGYEMGRPSDLTLDVEMVGQDVKSVHVGGKAIQVMSGTIEI